MTRDSLAYTACIELSATFDVKFWPQDTEPTWLKFDRNTWYSLNPFDSLSDLAVEADAWVEGLGICALIWPVRLGKDVT